MHLSSPTSSHSLLFLRKCPLLTSNVYLIIIMNSETEEAWAGACGREGRFIEGHGRSGNNINNNSFSRASPISSTNFILSFKPKGRTAAPLSKAKVTPTRGRQASFASTSNSDKSGKVPTAEASVTLISAQDCIVSVLDPYRRSEHGALQPVINLQWLWWLLAACGRLWIAGEMWSMWSEEAHPK